MLSTVPQGKSEAFHWLPFINKRKGTQGPAYNWNKTPFNNLWAHGVFIDRDISFKLKSTNPERYYSQ